MNRFYPNRIPEFNQVEHLHEGVLFVGIGMRNNR